MPPAGTQNRLLISHISNKENLFFHAGLKRKAQTPLSDENDDSSDSEDKEIMEIESETDENWDNNNKIVQISLNTKPIIGCECLFLINFLIIFKFVCICSSFDAYMFTRAETHRRKTISIE